MGIQLECAGEEGESANDPIDIHRDLYGCVPGEEVSSLWESELRTG